MGPLTAASGAEIGPGTNSVPPSGAELGPGSCMAAATPSTSSQLSPTPMPSTSSQVSPTPMPSRSSEVSPTPSPKGHIGSNI